MEKEGELDKLVQDGLVSKEEFKRYEKLLNYILKKRRGNDLFFIALMSRLYDSGVLAAAHKYVTSKKGRKSFAKAKEEPSE